MLQQQLNELLLSRAPEGTRSANWHSACPLNSCADRRYGRYAPPAAHIPSWSFD